jgi:hypothetical protein
MSYKVIAINLFVTGTQNSNLRMLRVCVVYPGLTTLPISKNV